MIFVDPTTFTIVLGFLLACVFSTAIGGGIFVLIGAMSLVLPVEAILPLHSAIMLSSQLSRCWLLWSHIDWSFAKSFMIGCAIGAPLGAFIYQHLPADAIALILATVMLYAAWAPPSPLKFRLPLGNVTIAAIHTMLSTAFSFGGLIQAMIFRQGFDKVTTMSTIALSMLIMSICKLPAYASFGFDYRPYFYLIAICWLFAPLGTWIGKRLLFAMPEVVFRYGFRVLLTIVAGRLVWIAI